MTPTLWVEHALDSCPQCGAGLAGGWVQRTREVIDLPAVPVRVTGHVYIARNCPVCERGRMPLGGPAGEISGKQRLGSNLLALIAALREEGRLPFRTIQWYLHMWYLKSVHGLSLSLGTMVQAVGQVARNAGPVVAGILEHIRGSPVVHADETVWRQDGHNGYVWSFSTPTKRYFLRRGAEPAGTEQGGGGRGSGR